MKSKLQFTKAFALTLALTASHFTKSEAALTSITSTGANTAAIQPSFDQFTTAIAAGGTNNGAQTGSITNGFRRVTWDAVPDASSDPNPLAPDFFNTTSTRGVVFSGANATFLVSLGGVGAEFTTINTNYSTVFETFSPTQLFTPQGTNVFDITFFLPGTTTPAAVGGFGIIFTDVDVVGNAKLECFDASGVSLGVFNAPVANQGLSFVGVSASSGKEKISRVRVTSGNKTIGAGIEDDAQNDLVVIDDLVYGEPQTVSLLQGYGFEKIKPKSGKIVKKKAGKTLTIKGKITSTTSNVLTSVKVALIGGSSTNGTNAATSPVFTEVTKFKLNKKNTRGFFKAKDLGASLPSGPVTVIVRGETANSITAVTSNTFTLERK